MSENGFRENIPINAVHTLLYNYSVEGEFR